VRRTRNYLETTINPATREPYLTPIGVELYGEEGPIALSGYIAEAYKQAEQFCQLLSRRIRSAGFLKTLLLRRIGSSIEAGKRTVNSMLAKTLGQSQEEEDQENMQGADTRPDTLSELYPLTNDEQEILVRCASLLETSTEEDPKWNVVLQYLRDEGWGKEGCVVFSQYYDTAYWVAKKIAASFPGQPVGLYAGAGKSLLLQDELELKREREELKNMVKRHEITILVGTDAASEGLNLQTLGTLINIDLPWNPTKLEQRKGRIQRIGQKRSSVKILNLRYKDSVEDRVHQVLAGRLEEIYRIFGQIPDVLENVWIDIALGEMEMARQDLDRLPLRNPFDERYSKIQSVTDWETCTQVLNRHEKLELLLKGW